MSRIVLQGCTPEPLSSYLKSIAILRLFSEQEDPNCKGYWFGSSFVLELNSFGDGLEDLLVQFFLKRYKPTPLVAPWNGGSGFYEGDKKDGLDAIRGSSDARVKDYRDAIETITRWPGLPKPGQSLGHMIEFVAAGTKDKHALERADAAKKELLRLQRADVDLSLKNLNEIREFSKMKRDASPAERKFGDDIRNAVRKFSKVLTDFKQIQRSGGKAELILEARNTLGDRVVEWVDAAVSIGSDGTLLFPPLLGTGGNEGHLDYTNAFMEFIGEMLLDPGMETASRSLLENALFGRPTSDFRVSHVGQYNPGRAGGYNQGPGIEHKDFPVNPWDFILCMEGTVAWAAGVGRRQGIGVSGVLCSPFTVYQKAVGYASSAGKDEGRSEIWTPLWNNPVGYPELKKFLSEGRAEVKGKRASDGLDFARAASSLGVDRGIREFIRYSLLKRRGDSYVALPADRFPVRERPEAALLLELDPLLIRLDAFMRGFKGEEGAPARFQSARRSIDEAIFTLLLRGSAVRVKELIAAIGRMEKLIARRDPKKGPKLGSPLLGLSPAWITAADDGSIEVRLAASLAMVSPSGEIGPLRANLEPVSPRKPWKWAEGGFQTAWAGVNLSSRISSVLNRRMMDAARFGVSGNPLYSPLPLHHEDIVAFIEGDVDESVLEDLLFGFLLVRWDIEKETREKILHRWRTPVTRRIVPRSWAILKLLFLSAQLEWPEGKKTKIPPEQSIIPLLNAGRVGEAVRIACRRLYSSGLSPFKAGFPDDADGLRLAASLLFPVRNSSGIAKYALTPTKTT